MAEQEYEGFTKPDFAIFADTGWEPKAVYDHLDWLEQQLSFPVIRVSNGNIREDILRGINPEGRKFIDIPVFVVKDNGKHYVGTRQCTKQYKLKPIHRYLRQYLGLKDGRLAPKDQQVDMWLGLSRDEAARVKPSKEAWITLVYPLLEKDLSRAQLYRWFKERYPDRDLPKSACIGCPYHTDQMWAEMKRNDPASFQDAVDVEWAMQNLMQSRGALTGTAYLHKTRVPLNEVEFNVHGPEATACKKNAKAFAGSDPTRGSDVAMKIHQFISRIKNGGMQLPAFQRGYVWQPATAAHLMDSLYREYPVGVITTWETESGQLIVDGQQRIGSIYACCTDEVPEVYRDEEKRPRTGLHFNVTTEEFKFPSQRDLRDPTWVSLAKS